MTTPVFVIALVAAVCALVVLYRIQWLFHQANARIDAVEEHIIRLGDATLRALNTVEVVYSHSNKWSPVRDTRKDDDNGTQTD